MLKGKRKSQKQIHRDKMRVEKAKKSGLDMARCYWF